jgi:hypothetical protein
MITLFGTSLSASASWLLLAIPIATTILIYTFRARGSGSPAVTSSLFIISKLPLHLPSRKSFVPPLQFWLELAAFLFLAAAAAGITASRFGQRIAIVIDTSTSMSARTAAQSTKLEEAKRLAQADLARVAPSTRYAVFSATTTLRPMTSGAVSSSTATAAINTAAQAQAADDLATTLSSLTSDPTYDGIWVYTDKQLTSPSDAARIRVTTIPLEPSVAQNLWIHSLSTTLKDGKSYLRLELFSSHDKPSHPTILATCESQEPQETFSLLPVGSAATPTVTKNQPATLELGPLRPSWSFCSVTLSPAAQEAADAISLDNTAYIANNPSSASITVMSPLSPEQLGLARLSSYSFVTETPTSNTGSTPTIFHRTTPTARPTAASLVVFPPEGSLPWKGGQSAAAPQTGALEISRWTETHPITRYTQPQLLSLPSARVLTCPDSATPILHSPYGALLCAGEEGGTRYVIVGFEIFPFDGMKSPTLSVLTLNMLNWLFHEDSGAHQNLALPAKLVNDQTTLERLAPERIEVPTNERAEALQRPGIIRASNETAPNSKPEFYASNSFIDEESDIARERAITLSPPAQRAATTESQDVPLERLLACIALAILFIDLARRLRRPGQWGSV